MRVRSFCDEGVELESAQIARLSEPCWRSSSITARSALLVSGVEEDHEFVGRVFSQQGWTLYKRKNLGSALAFLRDNVIPVVITERNLPLGDWTDLLAAIRHVFHPPLLIVTDRLADEYLWSEVLNLGGHDVLAKPFRESELIWVLSNAWRIAADSVAQARKPESKASSAGVR